MPACAGSGRAPWRVVMLDFDAHVSEHDEREVALRACGVCGAHAAAVRRRLGAVPVPRARLETFEPDGVVPGAVEARFGRRLGTHVRWLHAPAAVSPGSRRCHSANAKRAGQQQHTNIRHTWRSGARLEHGHCAARGRLKGVHASVYITQPSRHFTCRASGAAREAGLGVVVTAREASCARLAT